MVIESDHSAIIREIQEDLNKEWLRKQRDAVRMVKTLLSQQKSKRHIDFYKILADIEADIILKLAEIEKEKCPYCGRNLNT